MTNLDPVDIASTYFILHCDVVLKYAKTNRRTRLENKNNSCESYQLKCVPNADSVMLSMKWLLLYFENVKVLSNILDMLICCELHMHVQHLSFHKKRENINK